MPWKIFQESGKHCVYRVAEGSGDKMKKLKCYPARAGALAYQRALYASENKEKGMSEEQIEQLVEDSEELIEEIEVPAGITSFGQLYEYREAQEIAEKQQDLTEDYLLLVESIANNSNIEDKSLAFKKLAAEYYIRLKGEVSEVEEESEEKAVWTTAFVNDLPDSCFLYISPGGSKDESGKTKPRSLRHFPYKDSSGKVDLPHIRNAIARIPQANIPAEKKKSLQERARRILANAQGGKKEIEDDGLSMKIKSVIYDILGIKEKRKNGDFITWKEKDGRIKFMARYSNNFRDQDNPPEIISSSSHERFVNLVDKGDAGLPILEIWHMPEYTFGKATHVAYDNSGFALAVGDVFENDTCKQIASWLDGLDDIAMSHGMPTSSIKRDPDDPSVIIEHESVEISVLPQWAAANKVTDFVTIGAEHKENESMAIPQHKREALIEEWGADPELLSRLEALNAEDAEKAANEGIESKEATEEATEEVTEEVTETESTEETEVAEDEAEEETTTETAEAEQEEESETQSVDPLKEAPTRQEVVEFIADTVKPYLDRIDELGTAVKELTQAVETMAKSDEEKITKALLETPAASMSAMFAERFSAIGNEQTHEDGRYSLAKSKPKETPSSQFGVPLLNKLKAGEDVGGDYFES